MGGGSGVGSGVVSGSGTGATDPPEAEVDGFALPDAAVTVVVEFAATVVVEVVVTIDDVVDDDDAFFDGLEHALTATRREKNPKNATETSPARFALTIASTLQLGPLLGGHYLISHQVFPRKPSSRTASEDEPPQLNRRVLTGHIENVLTTHPTLVPSRRRPRLSGKIRLFEIQNRLLPFENEWEPSR